MGPTGSLIIGHTTQSSARVWVRGADQHQTARIRVRAAAESEAGWVAEERTELAAERDFTAAVSIRELEADTRYTVLAQFARSERDLERGRGVLEARGSFRTFPPSDSLRPFSFLHGSCNLSIVSLANLGSLVLGALGLLTAMRSIERPGEGLWRWPLRIGDGLVWLIRQGVFVGRVLRWVPRRLLSALRGAPTPEPPKPTRPATFLTAVFFVVFKLTGYKQPRPMLPSPFCELCKRLGPDVPAEERPAFMIHAGDQIYFDFPLPRREPKLDAYRLAYREAFLEDPAQRDFLASCPQYMTLDDHELVDGFALDHVAPSAGERRPEEYRVPGIQTYREYVHARHPAPVDGPLWYEFQHGASHFMVLDTRSGRQRARRWMLDEQQMGYLEEWLKEQKDELKFVVSSVPFLAELRSTASRGSASEGDERDDKWAGRFFRGQRDELLELVHREGIGRLVFLVGDMHCAYHAITRIGTPERRSTIHELAGGPIHQLQFAKREAFHDDYRGATRTGKVAFRTRMRQFHGAAAGVLQVTVRPGETPAVLWRVVRTNRSVGEASEPRPLSGRIDL